MSKLSVIASTLLVLSCSSSVELSSAPQLMQSADPSVLGVINEVVSNIVVDDERVYWLGTNGYPDIAGGALRSCTKNDCAGSLVTYGVEVNELAEYGVEGGQVYWLNRDEGPLEVWQLLTCAVTGCIGDPVIVQDGISGPSTTAFSGDAMYASLNGTLIRVPLSGAAAQQLPSNQGVISTLAVRADYVYWLGTLQGYEPTPIALERTRTDGNGTVEVLASNLEIPYEYQTALATFGLVTTGLAVDSKYAYWSQGTLRGEVDRCPLAGTCTPEVIAEPVRSPTTVALDGEKIYWQHDTASQGLALSSCTAEDCNLTGPLVQGVDAAASLAIDDTYLYTATTNQEVDPDVVRVDPSTKIRRIPK